MKATLALDDDVATLLDEAVRNQGRGLQEMGNELLRRTLKRLRPQARGEGTLEPQPSTSVPHTKSFPSGRCHLNNVDNVAEVLAWAEGERFR